MGSRCFPARVVTVILLAGVGDLARGQVPVDEIVLARGKPRFGEVLRIQGTAVVWQRCWADDTRLGDSTIQFKDLAKPDAVEVDVAPYECRYGNIVLGPTHLFWSDPDHGEIYARPVADLSRGAQGTNVVVGPHTPLCAANRKYLFARTRERYDDLGHIAGRVVAKPIERLADPSPEAWVDVASYDLYPYAHPEGAASEDYFVWMDARLDLGEETWRLYAKRTDELFVPGAERLVLDSMSDWLTLPVAIDGSLLVFQGALDPGANPYAQIYLIDLARGKEPIAVALASDPEVVTFSWPSISAHYVVWTEQRSAGVRGLSRRAYGRRLEAGVPVGDAFPLSEGASGSWMAFDRNIAVWSGGQVYVDGWFSYWGVVAAELPLPGAKDLGDVDSSGSVTITDAVIVVQYLFLGGPRPRLRLADANSSGGIDITDAILILQHLFCGISLAS